ncbi:hypothetical protein AB0E69_11015 [Kribbella sp. NPDC026611]|uniref:hypothetical protein n=1 Tax=Kribbella sp. NPDC026611 TaxID=3154911 RepID=UPI0033E6C15A
MANTIEVGVRSRRLQVSLLAAAAAWLAAAVALSAAGRLDQPHRPPLLFALFIVAPVTGALVAYAISRQFRTLVLQLPLAWVTAVHICRLVGVVFVIGVAAGTYPANFGLPAGIGDMVSALVAVPLTIALLRGSRSSGLRARYVVWNVFGLVDLVSAILLGLLYSDSAAGVLRGESSTAALADLPVSLIPTVYVPGLIMLHLLAFRRNAETAGGQARNAPSA